MTDHNLMNINGVSSVSSLASTLSGQQTQQIGLQLSVAIMKQALDAEQQMAAAMLKMIQESTPSLEGTGQIIDRRA